MRTNCLGELDGLDEDHELYDESSGVVDEGCRVVACLCCACVGRRRRRVGRRRCDCLMKPDADGNDEIVPI
jgi:hypothetical protein